MTAVPEGPDLQRIFDALALHNVEYLLVGGIAARAYGARRPTFDVDCVPEPSRANLDQLAAALRHLHARLRVEGLSDDEAALLPVQVTGSTLVRMELSTWRTDGGDLDILADIPDRHGRHMSYRGAGRPSDGAEPRRNRGPSGRAGRCDCQQRMGRSPQGSRGAS